MRWPMIVGVMLSLIGAPSFGEPLTLFQGGNAETTAGLLIRLRHETWDNVFDCDDDEGLDDAV